MCRTPEPPGVPTNPPKRAGVAPVVIYNWELVTTCACCFQGGRRGSSFSIVCVRKKIVYFCDGFVDLLVSYCS